MWCLTMACDGCGVPLDAEVTKNVITGLMRFRDHAERIASDAENRRWKRFRGHYMALWYCPTCRIAEEGKLLGQPEEATR